jgi:DNA (cytosine-5)-methyltransferase 1
MMAAYYNELDAQKAEWLRELMRRDLIAPGDVDERSIEQVQPTDLTGYRQCHWFAGIGAWSSGCHRPAQSPVWATP